MQETTACPSCQRVLRVPDDLKGQQVRCPSCASVFTAGAAEPILPPPAEPPPLEQEPARAAHAPRLRALPDEDDFDDRADDFDYRRRRRRRLDYEPHRGPAVLVLGILSCVICGVGLILGPLAWSMGSNDMTAIRDRRMDPEGESLTQAGMICGIVGTFLNLLGCGLYGCVFLFPGARRF
jgi:predicted Zn finger-like uncharacterized protein